MNRSLFVGIVKMELLKEILNKELMSLKNYTDKRGSEE